MAYPESLADEWVQSHYLPDEVRVDLDGNDKHPGSLLTAYICPNCFGTHGDHDVALCERYKFLSAIDQQLVSPPSARGWKYQCPCGIEAMPTTGPHRCESEFATVTQLAAHIESFHIGASWFSLHDGVHMEWEESIGRTLWASPKNLPGVVHRPLQIAKRLLNMPVSASVTYQQWAVEGTASDVIWGNLAITGVHSTTEHMVIRKVGPSVLDGRKVAV